MVGAARRRARFNGQEVVGFGVVALDRVQRGRRLQPVGTKAAIEALDAEREAT